MVYVTFVISACIWPIAMIFSLFRKDFRSGNSFQLSPFAWPQRLTLKLNVTSCLRDISHFCLYLCYRKDFFFVLQRFWVREFILIIATRVTFTYDLETEGHVIVYVTFVISGHLYVSYRNDFFVLSGFQIKEFILTIATCVTTWVTLKREVPSLTTWQIKKSRRQWRDLRFSRSSVKITQLAIVRMNSLN